MRLTLTAMVFFSFSVFANAATPAESSDAAIATFRVEAAEVHVAFSAFDKHQRPIGNISANDFVLLRDGKPIEQKVSIERRDNVPVSATVLTDVSDSMIKAVPMARESWGWMNATLQRKRDQISYLDFGAELAPAVNSPSHITEFYDSVLKVLEDNRGRSGMRKALIIFTDGRDNNSMHALEDVVRAAVQRDVAIYAITTWKYNINYDEQVLDYLTSATGGRYFPVKNSKEMDSALLDIYQELSNGYELVFRADTTRAGLHTIGMRPTNSKIHFYHRAAYFQPEGSTLLALTR